MGGGNANKSARARELKQKDTSKTPEERKAALAQVAKDKVAQQCVMCKATFMVNVKLPDLYVHVTTKHPAGTDPTSCFPALAGFDPEDPKGLKAAAAAAAAAKSAKKPAKKKKDEGLDDLLSAGLKKGKKK